MILVNVVYLNFALVAWNIGHHEILFDRRRKHRVPAIINMFSDDVDTTRSAHEECWGYTIQLLKPLREILVSGDVLLFDVSISVVICLLQLGQDRDKLIIL